MDDLSFRNHLLSLKAKDALSYMIDKLYEHESAAIRLMEEANGRDWTVKGPYKLVKLIEEAIVYNLRNHNK